MTKLVRSRDFCVAAVVNAIAISGWICAANFTSTSQASPPYADYACCDNTSCKDAIILSLDSGGGPSDGCDPDDCSGTCARCTGTSSKYTCWWVDDNANTCTGIAANPYFSCGVQRELMCDTLGKKGPSKCCPPASIAGTTTTTACSPAECDLNGSDGCPAGTP